MKSHSIALGQLVCSVILAGYFIFPTTIIFDASGQTRPREYRSGATKDPTNNWNVPPDSVDQLVRYPSPEIAFICGPQLKAGSSLNPFLWFDSVAITRGKLFGEKTPRVAPVGPMSVSTHTKQWQSIIAGRISIMRGTTTVLGRGTRFTLDVDAAGPLPYGGHFRIRDASGTDRNVQVRSIESDTQLTLTLPWAFASVNEAVADTFFDDHGTYGANTDHYYLNNYYDTALVQYINYYRTADPRFLGYARKTADAFWHSMWIGDGTVTEGFNHLPPRSMAFAGLMLRALDGRPEMWDYLDREVRATFESWVYRRRHDPRLYYDIREDGFAQLYAVMLARVLPDSYPLFAKGTLQPRTGVSTDGAVKRATYLSQTEQTAINFFGRLQRPDGSWRWDADGSSNPAEQQRDVEQPFMVGLYLESLVLLHQLTQNPHTKSSLINQLTRSVRHLYFDAFERNHPVTDLPPYRWRSMVYFWGGGTVANPRQYSPPTPSTRANGDRGQVTMARHLNSTIHHAFGYAYYATGDRVYKEMGDDVFEASYGDRIDGLHCLADSGKAKDYDMNFRASGRYLVWRLAAPKQAQTT
jgi:hypothetical protein